MGPSASVAGDEVIVPPYTMSATAMAPCLWGDSGPRRIDPDTFCLDPCGTPAITPRTKAIIAVNLFGHPAPLTPLMALAQEYGLSLVEDNAQAPLAMDEGRMPALSGILASLA